MNTKLYVVRKMMINPDLEKFMTSTILGILLLGVIGSILGAIVIHMLKMVWIYCHNKWRYLNENWPDILGRIFYRHFKDVLTSERYRDYLLSQNNQSHYLVWCLQQAVSSLMFTMSLVLSLGFTFYILITFELDKPTWLSLSISINIYLLFTWVIHVLKFVCLIPEKLDLKFKEIEENMPKNFNEWKKNHY